jgi:hypothetical protein
VANGGDVVALKEETGPWYGGSFVSDRNCCTVSGAYSVWSQLMTTLVILLARLARMKNYCLCIFFTTRAWHQFFYITQSAIVIKEVNAYDTLNVT